MITLYSKPNCGYCERAKTFLQARNIDYEELIIDVGQKMEANKNYVTVEQLRAKVPLAVSVPQILQDGILIGGYAQLVEYVKNGGASFK